MSNNNNKNPFADFLAGYSTSNPFAAECDWDSVVNAGRQNAKAWSDAAKAASEGIQAIARRQAEVAQKSVEEFSKFFKDASSTKSPEEGIAKQVEFTKCSLESAIKNCNEISEIASKSNKEASDIISKRISNALSEVAANANSSSKKKTSAAA
ncbi:MAG: phasin [Alphaproteobacteria bacterium CG11_big_fil_rev_8_21_14_0_20_39_49]|nr:MAG: phasin [Alphaproteobacteria bacterium CG11_big_fil_rev_8_21_14_0_20_39_49]